MANSANDRLSGEELIRRYREGNFTEEERRMVEAWYERIRSGVPLPDEDTMMGDLARIHARIEAAKDTQSERISKEPRKIAGYKVVAAAAAVVLLALGSLFYFQWMTRQGMTDPQAQSELWSAADQISPGGNRATLTLADGRSVELSTTQTGIVLGNEGIQYADGTPLFESWVAEGSSAGRSQGNQKFIIRTPPGGTYQVLLSDGSKVWLNAASTLTYPSRFASGTDRVVELDGEAYFEVTRGSEHQSFFVKSKEQTIEVLGTRFNVTAYADDPATITTLVEGRVSVSPVGPLQDAGNSTHPARVFLSPNQQSTLQEQTIETKTVDVSSFIAWKDGAFSFSGKSFQQVVGDIGRWYDLEIIYDGPIPAEQFFGEAYRSEKLSVILKMLESNSFAYRLEDRKLIITNKL